MRAARPAGGRGGPARAGALLAGLLGLAAPQLAGAEPPDDPPPESAPEVSPEVSGDFAVTFDFDDPPETRNQLAPGLTFGGKVTLGFDYERNHDLDRGEDDDLATLTPELELAFSYDPLPWFRGFVDFELTRPFDVEAPGGRDPDDAELLVKEAFVNLREIWGGLSLTLGRQEFKDEREWLYDEELDALRLFLRNADFGLEASVSREELVDKDLLNGGSERKIDNYFLLGRYAFGAESELAPYLLYRDDRSGDDEDLLFLGLQSSGALTSGTDYWLEFAHVRGREGSRDIRGYGFDLGATHVFDAPLEPSLTLGAAFGTGDDGPGGGPGDDPGDDRDRNFRQTGLQDNNDRFNGVTGFKYYGEVLDPELSNLLVLTVGLGLRPSRRSSLDLVYHHYRQHQASEAFRDAGIDAEPEGRDRTIGNGLDLVFGYREIENFDAEAVFGLFFPGAAFPSDAETAYFVGVELEIDF